MKAVGPNLQESLEITYPLLSRACRLVRVMAALAGEQEVHQQAAILFAGLQAVTADLGIAAEPRDARGLMALELRRALDVLAEANAKRLRGHGGLSADDGRLLDQQVGRLSRLGETLVAAIHQLPPAQV